MKDIDDDKQKLIDYSVEFATKMLTDYHEFFPFAVTINLQGNLVMASYFDDDDHPLSQNLIYELNKTLAIQLDNKEIQAYALTYDVRVQRDNSSDKTDAIAIKITHIKTKETMVHYFSYKLTERNIIQHIDSWKQIET